MSSSRFRLPAFASSSSPLRLAFFAPLVLTGCALTGSNTPGTVVSQPALMTGSLHGGQQSIAFSTVQIWAVGTTGYGSAGTLYATTTTADDGAGSFAFNKVANTDTPYPGTGNTWACPASSDPYMYITARGGNTQGTHDPAAVNSAAGFLLAVGKCSTITPTTFYYLNELTTVASMAAVTQYFNPTSESIGGPSTALGKQGLANAFAVIPSLIDVHTGLNPGNQLHDSFVSSLSDSTKMNTIADILAACVNTPSSTSSNCSTLFTNATPPDATTTSQPTAVLSSATDVLQALYFMYTSLSDGDSTALGNLYGLVQGTAAPFQPTLTTAPTDWSVGITYYTSTSGPECSGNYLFSPVQAAVANNGHAAFLSSSSTNSAYLSLLPGGSADTLACSGGQQAGQLNYDVAGNYWIAITSSSQLASSTATGGWATPEIPGRVVSDGSGNIFYTSQNTGNVYEIPASAVPSAPFTGQEPASLSHLVATLAAPAVNMIADASGNLWAVCSDGNLYEMVKASSYAASLAYNVGTSFPASPSSLAIDASGAVVFPYNNGTQYVGHLSGSPGAYTFTTSIGAYANNGVAIDGAGNIWTASEGTYNINSVNSGFITEQSSTGTNLIPGYGLTRPASSGEFSSALVQNTVVTGPSNSLAVDLSGNLWVVNSFTNMFNTTDGQKATVTEFVGSAVPTVTSHAYALSTHTVATKP